MNLFPVSTKTAFERAPATPPKVTAIVTLYNYAIYIEECLASLATQTQQDLELIVVDDHSTDNGLWRAQRWLEQHAGKFSGCKLFVHTENMGLSCARNTAFAAASSARVFSMDADNLLYPRAIERCMQAMDASGAAGAYTQLEFFGEQTGLGEADYWSKDRFKPKNYIDAMALVSKAAWTQVGGYSQLIANGWEDYDFWCKFVEHGLECTYVPEILCRYRVHKTSMSHTETNPNAPALILQMSLRHPWLTL